MTPDELAAFQKGWMAAGGKGSPLNPYPYDLQPNLFREFARGYREGKEFLEALDVGK